MSIPHIFWQHTWQASSRTFQTRDGILNCDDCEPKIFFLGTFNPDMEGNNPEIFYGRNYFWPALFNLLAYKDYKLMRERITKAQVLPSSDDILDFCFHYRFVFADLISEVLHHNNPDYVINSQVNGNRTVGEVTFLGKPYNLILDHRKMDSKTNQITYGLDDLAKLGQVNWNTLRIRDFLKENTSIDTVYITRNPAGSFESQWNELKGFSYGRPISFRRIFTPSVQGSGKGVKKMHYLIQHWLHKFPFNGNYEGLDLNWIGNYLNKSEITNLLNT